MPLKIVSLSIQSSDAGSIGEPLRRLEDELGIEADLFSVNSENAEDDIAIFQELERKTREADFVFVRCMSDTSRFKRYDRYAESLKVCGGHVFLHSGNLEVSLLNRSLFKGSDADYAVLRAFAANRGADNDYGILRWVAKARGLTDLPVPEPVEQRSSGIYHPDHPRDIGKDEYLRGLGDGPVVGLMFPGSLWIYDNLDHIDALIHSLEAGGAQTIPIFFSVSSFSAEGSEGSRGHVREYFTSDGDVLIDALIVCSPFSQLVNSRTGRGLSTEDAENYYRTLLNVPVIHAMTVNGDYHDFEHDRIGLGKHDIAANVAWPEIDGQIISVPIGFVPKGGPVKRTVPVMDRIDHISRLAISWGSLRRKPAKERKVAILLYQSRPDSGNIGGAAGLDSVESVSDLLGKLHRAGYTVDRVPESGKQLIGTILDGITNDLDNVSTETLRDRAADLVPSSVYREAYRRIPEFDRRMTEEDWGAPPGNICVDGCDIVIPGIVNGNIFLGYQPMRGWAETDCHDPTLFAQHQYIAYYAWIRDAFGADLIIHVGTHGTLEWLPGKNVGMSAKCNPDFILDGLPNLYPYIIDDPGEGIQAKRRIESVLIGHMGPTMARAGSYDAIEDVNIRLQEYFKARGTASEERKAIMIAQVYGIAEENNLLGEIGASDDPGPAGFEPYIDALHDYITDVKDALIRSDLHVLGRPPAEHHLCEAVYSLMRLDNGDIPSLRYAFAENAGVDLRRIIDSPSDTSADGEINSVIIDRVDDGLQEFIAAMDSYGYETGRCLEALTERYGRTSPDLEASVRYACEVLVPNILRMTDEIDNILAGLNGEYVLPGPSGAPTRGNAHILPMGRNYYGIDPDTIPCRSSWEIGVEMADRMIERYVSERGTYPREVGFIIWATDTMKTGGDDVAYILWLMGVRPVWSGSGGQVADLELIPLGELGRPRIDVTVNITGLFRDTFPNLIDMIDDAVKLVSCLDESDEDNAIAANLRRDLVDDMIRGIDREESLRKNSVRVFGAPPGAYGTGVNKMIENSSWNTVEDLADTYLDWCSYGYARGDRGISLRDEFMRRFGRVEVTVKNMPDREIDLLDCDDVYQYLGGMNAFVRAYGRKDAISVMGDGSDPDRIRIRDTANECKYVFRSKIMNPKFMNGLKEHGYRGAAELAGVTEFVMAWDATSDIVEDWMYEDMAERFLFDRDTREWMEDVNVHAMMNIINRLQEAIGRGLWDATDEMRERLKDLYLETEGRVEEITDR